MGILTKILIGAGIGGGIIAAVSYAMRLKRTGTELETVNNLMLHKVDLKGIVLRVDSTLKNPTKTPLKIKFPFVKLIYKDAVIGSSQVVNKDIEIPAYGEARIEKIMIQVPLVGIFSLGADLIKSLQSGQGVKMNVKTISTVDLGFKQLPYEKTDEMILKKEVNASQKV